MFTESISFPAAFAAGLLSFFSPCILPLIPAYFAFITGFGLEEMTSADDAGVRRRVIASTVAYVLGFSTVFVLMGASASFLGGFLATHAGTIRIAGGVVIIGFGVHLTGLVRLPGLDTERRLEVRKKPLHLAGTYLVGMAFAAGWTPCIGPLLGSILIVAGSRETVWEGVRLLTAYSAGLAVPFLLISVFIRYLFVILARIRQAMRYLKPAAGMLLIVVGVSLVVDWL